ncbi:uncharacterized protein AMSG_05316 [Thecamonas trahens ATCC 50062]|uniref:Battenin n=1 Tax=Thecamonas trahens ATCC 50062 TaxID=461836 RepID=A0A0L0DAD7_THETB|nr:hypothetical protein AMSG_05316 [Thecamonas trahens ATCC 50062]KNC49319.1 hypothetical protein AMSG_05316 [Thecamonas trahens ATCC 50062]|eukprot:XP_013758027.1 hypothetical protein AMSG_05316 [Thecamonas trahens ATCC 50062]
MGGMGAAGAVGVPMRHVEDAHYARNWIGFFIMGTINNFAYVAVNSKSKDLAKQFHKESAIGAILWANVATGALIQMINAAFLERTSTSKRMTVVAALFLAGLTAIAFSPDVDFYFMLFAVVLVGTGTSFGQCVMVGELKRYSPTMVGGWSSGTGLAGIAGSFTMILFSYLELSVALTFFLLLPLVAIYVFTFFIVLKPPTADDDSDGVAKKALGAVSVAASLNTDAKLEAGSAVSERTALISPIDASVVQPGVEVGPPNETGAQRVLRCLRLVTWLGLNMGAVYFFEYWISVGCAADAEPHHISPRASFWERKSFVILAACYQLGVFVSRSSLRFFKISRIEILTVLQGLNLGFWLADDIYKWMPYYIQFVAMFYVGLLGGTSFVNTLFKASNDPRTPESDRKLTLYIILIFVNVGIGLAAAAVLIADATFLADQVPKNN